MKRALLLLIATASCAFAQERGDVIYQTTGSVSVASGGFDKAAGPVLDAPYSATTKNESVQTLADGNRLVQTSTGTTARDSQGRTRQETALPAIGNLSAEHAPRLVFIHDPVTQTSYTLNLTEKTAQKLLAPPPPSADAAGVAGPMFTMRVVEASGPTLPPPDAMPTTVAAHGPGLFLEKHLIAGEPDQASTEDLGSQTMEGVLVNGVRTTHTIPAGQIGNERPITIVTEVWTSPELRTVVYSKRSDPRVGEQTFRLTNIVQAEPSGSLFTVPVDFKIVEGPQPIFYQRKQ